MAAVNPPYALQNAGATHTAENDRLAMGSLIAGARASGSMTSRGGVAPAIGGGLAVTTANSGLTVNIASGVAYVPGTESTKQGVYVCTNDATVSITLDAAHGTLARIDRIVARVYDSAYSGSTNVWAIEKVTGTPSGSPVAPTLPANSISLASISVPAADTLIDQGQIADDRPILPQGVIACASNNKPALNTVANGQMIAFTDIAGVQVKLGTAGGVWQTVSYPAQVADVQIFTSSGTWTKPAGATTVIVECIGGGGAGGGAPATGASQVSGGSGGQAGAYCKSVSVAALATETVTVGTAGTGVSGASGNNGGTSSFGSWVSAAGGAGGPVNNAGGTPFTTTPGDGSQAMTGQIQVKGQPGTACSRLGTQAGQVIPGIGGSTVYGTGGAGGHPQNGGNGANASGFGGGGGGGSNAPSMSARTGGNGSPGVVIVTTLF